VAVLPVCRTVETKAKCLSKMSKKENEMYGKSFLPFYIQKGKSFLPFYIQSVSAVCIGLMVGRVGHAFARRGGHLQLVTLLLG